MRKSERRRTDERIQFFINDPFYPLLHNHALHHPYAGCRSINMTGDLRAIYEEIGSETVHFIALGTHAELYR